jgi:hypothetical protein
MVHLCPALRHYIVLRMADTRVMYSQHVNLH